MFKRFIEGNAYEDKGGGSRSHQGEALSHDAGVTPVKGEREGRLK